MGWNINGETKCCKSKWFICPGEETSGNNGQEDKDVIEIKLSKLYPFKNHPFDLEQRSGRIVRQGNEKIPFNYFNVRDYIYYRM